MGWNRVDPTSANMLLEERRLAHLYLELVNKRNTRLWSFDISTVKLAPACVSDYLSYMR